MLDARGLSKSYGTRTVLDNLNLGVEAGELTAIVGASGEGKTTFLRVIAGFENADAGVIQLDGEAITTPQLHVPPHQRKIGFVAQDGALFPHLSVVQNVAFGLPRGSRRNRRAAEMLELVGLADRAKNRPNELSGGQQQRVALARALAPDPRIILLDEPFAALDPTLRERLREDVRLILKAAGTTAILVTHDQTEALSLCDRVAILADGRIAQHDTPAAIYRHPADSYTASFFGDAVLLSGNVLANGDVSTVLGTHTTVEHTLDVGAATVLIRPEQVRCISPAEPNSRVGTVTDVRFYGHDALVTIALETTEAAPTTITSRVDGYDIPAPGDRVTIDVHGAVALIAGSPK